ncbi:phosphatidylserine decarboxylase [Oribacterium sp.]
MGKEQKQKEQNSPSIIERKTGRLIQEEEYGQKAIYFLYHHFLGRVLLKMIFARPYFSFLRGLYYNSFISKKEIAPFVEKYGLSKKYLKKNYQSFGAFFSRKEAVNLREAGKENTKENGEAWKEKVQEKRYEKGHEKGHEGKLPFYATSSGKLLAYKIDQEGQIIFPGSDNNGESNLLPLEIKGNYYSIEKILKAPCPEFLKGGTLLVFRLSLPDYHRYIFPARGKLLRTKKIKGRLDSVRKEAAHFKALSENKREISLLELEGMGRILHVEVGAMLVGHIHNHRKNQLPFRFQAGEEKGYFSLGGSTIVEMLSDKIVIDEDLFENTNKGLETKLEIGERIGYGKA